MHIHKSVPNVLTKSDIKLTSRTLDVVNVQTALQATDSELIEITTMTVPDTSFYEKDYWSELLSEGEENNPLVKTFIPFPAYIYIHRKLKLWDAEISEQHKQ